MLTVNQLRQIVPTLSHDRANSLLPGIIDACNYADINTPARTGGFLAQCAHESQGFATFTENLNYSASALRTYFRNHFTEQEAIGYQRKPERIANRAYANRLGNGNEASGDGWKFRGRGAIQCTGREKYEVLSQLFNIDFVNQPDLLSTPDYAFLSAAWYWKDRKINVFADAKDIRRMTVAVNGGMNGFADRKEYYDRARQALGF